MNTQLTESVWLNEIDVCRIEHLAEVSGLSIEEIEDLIENGVITPIDYSTKPRYFQLRYVLTVKTARRLRDDFQLDQHGVTLALALLRRISALEAQLNSVQAIGVSRCSHKLDPNLTASRRFYESSENF